MISVATGHIDDDPGAQFTIININCNDPTDANALNACPTRCRLRVLCQTEERLMSRLGVYSTADDDDEWPQLLATK